MLSGGATSPAGQAGVEAGEGTGGVGRAEGRLLKEDAQGAPEAGGLDRLLERPLRRVRHEGAKAAEHLAGVGEPRLDLAPRRRAGPRARPSR